MGSLSFRAGPKDSPLHPHHHNIGGPKVKEVTLPGVPLPRGPSVAIAGHSGISMLLMVLQGDPLSPVGSLNSHFLIDHSSDSN